MEQIFLQESLGLQEKVTWVSSEWYLEELMEENVSTSSQLYMYCIGFRNKLMTDLIRQVIELTTSKSQYTRLLTK